MPLLATVLEDMKRAMREGDTVARDTLRMLKSELDRAALEKGGALADEDELGVVMRAVKTRRETVEQARAGGREDLAANEEREIAVLGRYLPRPFDDREAQAAVRDVVERLGASGPGDVGAVLKAVMAEHRGRIDGRRAKEIASDLLR